MRQWGVATNSYYKYGFYLLREAKWYIFALQWLNFAFYAKVVKYLTFKSRLSSRYFYRVAVPLYRKLEKNVKRTYVPRDWDALVNEQPKLMQKEVNQSQVYENDRVEIPNFDWVEFNTKKKEYMTR